MKDEGTQALGSQAAPAGIRVPEVVIEPRRGWMSVNWGELWQRRELLYFLAWRDVKVRYKQTVLGILWALLQPCMKMVVLSVVFGRLAGVDSEGYEYPIFVFAGLLPWQFFADALGRSSQSVVESARLVGKVYFPRLLIPFSSVTACLVDFAISFVILGALMLYYGVVPTAATLMVVPLVLWTILTALGAGVFLSALNVAYRDFRHVVPFIVQIWFFLTPVIYPASLFKGYGWVLSLNPMAGIVDGYRSAILGKPFDWGNLRVSLAMATALFLVGTAYFRRIERQFADII